MPLKLRPTTGDPGSTKDRHARSGHINCSLPPLLPHLLCDALHIRGAEQAVQCPGRRGGMEAIMLGNMRLILGVMIALGIAILSISAIRGAVEQKPIVIREKSLLAETVGHREQLRRHFRQDWVR